MASYYRCLSILTILSTLAVAQECDLQFDGRVPSNFAAATFNSNNGIFDPNNVVGQGMPSGL
jgi:hypothetical protein